MRRATLLLLAILAVPGTSPAQGAGDRRGWVFGFAGVGSMSGGGPAVFSTGGGGELLVGAGLAVGGEVGYLARSGTQGSGLAAVDVGYYFRGRDARRRLVPFVSGGAAAAFRKKATAGGGNFGGGVQYWLRERVALRLEVRDFIFSSDSPHTWVCRLGIAFR